jgi:hypothetical protein
LYGIDLRQFIGAVLSGVSSMTAEVHHSNQEVEQPGKDQPKQVNSGLPNFFDILFLIFLACMLALVAWVGVLSHEEGLKNEVTKQNGEAWVKWMKENSEARTKEDFEIESCAISDAERKRWGDCFKELSESVEPLNKLINPFTNKSVEFVAKCDPKDPLTIGGIFLEKIVATPAGSAIPTVASQLVETDPIDTKLNLKMTVCDKGGYAIKVDEFEF